jgi:hypothetical protein
MPETGTKTFWQFLDKFIHKGLIPIALVIAGPWAAYTYSTDAARAKENSEETKITVSELRALQKQQQEVVAKLDETLRISLIQMAVIRVIAENTVGENLPERAEVIENTAAQMAMPNIDRQEFNRVAKKTYDGYVKTRRK